MKTIFFFFAMLVSVAACAQVTVTPVSVDYDKSEVKFRVAWNAATAVNNRVWVWVDFCSVAGTTPSTFAPATITSASVTFGTPTDLNGRGVFVTANGATVTAQLNATGKFNWCAYGSDYPPNILDYVDGTYTLRGTPPFTLKDANGNTQKVAGTTITQSSLTITPITMTDETGCPGYFCKYVGMDLYMNVSYPCQQRAGGAQNWEAWIKDNRDDQIYRITQFSDGSWWMADDLAIAEKSVATCNGKHYYQGYDKPTCPSGWQLPTDGQLLDRFPNPSTTDAHGATITAGCYYGDSDMCGKPGCNECEVRYDMVLQDAINTRVWDTDVWKWNCYRQPTEPGTLTGIAARARCIRNQ
ncbi:MAG: hypothetical protein LBU42_08415 [Prevotellaceae bacterium]|nr:hypothetical protein [Prevotellaceae bacterium]